MTILELLNLANQGYPDGHLANYYNEITGERFTEAALGMGDTLAEFIVIELSETFDPDTNEEKQIAEAIKAMRRAGDDITDVINSLEMG